MKTIPPPCPEPESGRKYWRSLDQLAETPEFRQWVEREFPAGASEFNDPVSRRHFVKIMSASFMLAGLGLTRLPSAGRKHFSVFEIAGRLHSRRSAIFRDGHADVAAVRFRCVVKSNDGRPRKSKAIRHPDSNGGTDLFTQASILNLYDPDRAMRFTKTAHDDSAKQRICATLQTVRSKRWQGSCVSAGTQQFAFARSVCKSDRGKISAGRWFMLRSRSISSGHQAATQRFGAIA